MADEEDVRRIALSLPETTEEADQLRFLVAGRAFAWSWRERVEPRKPRVERRDVLPVSVIDLAEKDALIAMNPAKFFTEPHYDGYKAVLVRLGAVGVDELTELITDAWRCRVPRRLARQFPDG